LLDGCADRTQNERMNNSHVFPYSHVISACLADIRQ